MTSQDISLKRCFTQPSVIAYRRPKNVGDLLFRAKISLKRKSQRNKDGFTRCGKMCKACIHSPAGASTTIKTHKNDLTGEEWEITSSLDCKSKDVIYLLKCDKCFFWPYVGESMRSFCERLAEHRYSIINNVDNTVGRHFNLPGHSVANLRAIPIEKISGSHGVRKARERVWINRYDSVTHGGNIRK